jgi:hypothetical protein
VKCIEPSNETDSIMGDNATVQRRQIGGRRKIMGAKAGCASDHDDFARLWDAPQPTLSEAAFQPQSTLTAKLGWTAQFNEARVTSDQHRNVMACRKLAQQRVLRIMQQQSAEQAARLASERSADAQGRAPNLKSRRHASEKRDF